TIWNARRLLYDGGRPRETGAPANEVGSYESTNNEANGGRPVGPGGDVGADGRGERANRRLLHAGASLLRTGADCRLLPAGGNRRLLRTDRRQWPQPAATGRRSDSDSRREAWGIEGRPGETARGISEACGTDRSV